MKYCKIIKITITTIGLIAGLIGIKTCFFDKSPEKAAQPVLEIQDIALQKQETSLQNQEKIIQLLEEKGYKPDQQLVNELQEKVQELEKELEERTPEDKRAEVALTAFKAGDYDMARELYEAVREEEKKKEKEHAKTAYDLGNVYFIELKFPEALQSYLDAVRLAPDNSSYLNEVGYTYYILAKYDSAIEYLEKALQSDLKTFREDHPNVAIRWNNLGLAWNNKGEYDRAIEYYEKALQSDLKTFGEDHPNVARDWNNLGGVPGRIKVNTTGR